MFYFVSKVAAGTMPISSGRDGDRFVAQCLSDAAPAALSLPRAHIFSHAHRRHQQKARADAPAILLAAEGHRNGPCHERRRAARALSPILNIISIATSLSLYSTPGPAHDASNFLNTIFWAGYAAELERRRAMNTARTARGPPLRHRLVDAPAIGRWRRHAISAPASHDAAPRGPAAAADLPRSFRS